MKKRTKILLAVLSVLLALTVPGLFNGLHVVRYTVTDERIAAPVRIALVTDLHACVYGDGQRELLDAIKAEQPDLLLLGGDLFDVSLPDAGAAAFLRGLPARLPRYFVTGNHEYYRTEAEFRERMALLEACGVVRLSGEAVSLRIGGSTLTLCGVDDPTAWGGPDAWPVSAEGSFRDPLSAAAAARDGYTVLLSHRPELFRQYGALGFDLVLTGHAHGGQWRIPGVLNGLYAPHQGLFPAWAGGRYEEDGTTMIVSRGLARENTWVPRIYNRPELVIVDLTPEGDEP